MNNLHPGGRWIYRVRAYYSLFIICIIIAVWSFQIFRLFGGDSISMAVVTAIIFYILFVVVVAEIYARMSYNRFLYEINNDEIKIEQGIIWKKYSSIPYERVQNVDIQRGIIARMFGFSTVQIETAGQSGFGGQHGIRFGRGGNRQYKSEGYLPAIDVNGTEKIRAFVMKKIKQTHKDSGM
ncbi:MAG: PH domain-containing protein [Nanoarchaeota archaeon]